MSVYKAPSLVFLSFFIPSMCRLGWSNVYLFLFFLQDRRFHIILFDFIFCLVIFVKYDMELRFQVSLTLASLDPTTHVSDEGLDKFVRMPHIGEDESKVVLGCPQQVRTEHDSERFCSHMVLFFEVGDPERNDETRTFYCQRKQTHLSRCSATRFSKSKLARGSA